MCSSSYSRERPVAQHHALVVPDRDGRHLRHRDDTQERRRAHPGDPARHSARARARFRPVLSESLRVQAPQFDHGGGGVFPQGHAAPARARARAHVLARRRPAQSADAHLDDLRDNVQRTLEHTGVLSEIRARLRAANTCLDAERVRVRVSAREDSERGPS